jgi:hypothetical protein
LGAERRTGSGTNNNRIQEGKSKDKYVQAILSDPTKNNFRLKHIFDKEINKWHLHNEVTSQK